jgi:transposase
MVTKSTRRYKRVSEGRRIQIITLREQQYTLREISKKTKVKEKTVQAILYKWKQYNTVQDLPKRGRPRKTDNRTAERLARIVQKGEVDNASELVIVAAAHDIAHISARTARRVLHQQGLNAMHMIKKPLLTREHKRKRLEFARAHCGWTVEQWKQVIFSDETVILARSSDEHKIKWTKPTRRLNRKLVIPTVQGGGVVIMVWGCISQYGFHDLILLDGIVDAKGYITVLHDYLIPIISQYFGSHPCIFQQDNATVHTAYEVADFFHTNDVQVLEWPAHSPDLNIIEHMWHYLKERVRLQPSTSIKQDLWSNVQSVMDYMWGEEITQKINDLYESLPNRMQAVIDADGGNTRY